MTKCKFCGADIFVFTKAPRNICDSDSGWASDYCGDPVEDFICPVRETTGRYPDGKPHEPKEVAVGEQRRADGSTPNG